MGPIQVLNYEWHRLNLDLTSAITLGGFASISSWKTFISWLSYHDLLKRNWKNDAFNRLILEQGLI